MDCRGDASAIRLSKIWYYLVDNIYNLVLSQVMGRVQEESGRTAERFPNWNQGGAWKKVGHHSVCVQLRKTPPKRSLDGAPSKVDRWRGCPGQPPARVTMRDGVAGLSSRRTSNQSDGLESAANARSRAFWLSRWFSTIRLLTVSALGYRIGIPATEHAQEGVRREKTVD